MRCRGEAPCRNATSLWASSYILHGGEGHIIRVLRMSDSVEVGDNAVGQCVLSVGPEGLTEQASWSAMESSAPSSPPHGEVAGAILDKATAPGPVSSKRDRSLLAVPPTILAIPNDSAIQAQCSGARLCRDSG